LKEIESGLRERAQNGVWSRGSVIRRSGIMDQRPSKGAWDTSEDEKYSIRFFLFFWHFSPQKSFDT
jgi:hypothetical protein